jgi:citrate/tricarballylate utilization protein
MATLDSLVRDARALADGGVVPVDAQRGEAAVAEVARVMQICNACRYCEGFCAVFPAMTRRLAFPQADVHYLANLCHHCGACLHACQYAPPHEFAVNVPQAMAAVRASTYQEYAWPPALGALYRRNGLTVALALVAALTAFLVLALVVNGTWWGRPGGTFYDVFPHGLLVSIFLPVFGASALAMAMGLRGFWRAVTPVTGAIAPGTPALAEAAHAAATLKYLDGGHGEGCHEADDAWTHARRRAHHLTAYGFGLCFLATATGTLYHYVFGWAAPYALPSLPKLLGATGGVMMVLGTAGLWRLNTARHPQHAAPSLRPMDRAFTALLFLVAASGLALWGANGHASLPLWLAFHLATVMALFLTLPYGKFAHALFRGAALVRHAVEKRLPNPIGLGSD